MIKRGIIGISTNFLRASISAHLHNSEKLINNFICYQILLMRYLLAHHKRLYTNNSSTRFSFSRQASFKNISSFLINNPPRVPLVLLYFSI